MSKNWFPVIAIAIPLAIQDLMPLYQAKHSHCFLIKSPFQEDTIKKILCNQSGNLNSSKEPMSLCEFTEDSNPNPVRQKQCTRTSTGNQGIRDNHKGLCGANENIKVLRLQSVPPSPKLLLRDYSLTRPLLPHLPCDRSSHYKQTGIRRLKCWNPVHTDKLPPWIPLRYFT